MANKTCMNENCRITNSLEWKRGWGLKLGGFATLCYSCGSAYQNLIFCEKFHLEESGWRECKYCGKRLHCGCIASKYLHHYLDFGGVGCLRCVKDLETQSVQRNQHIPTNNLPNGFIPLSIIHNPQSSLDENRINSSTVDTRKHVQLARSTADGNQPICSIQSENGINSSTVDRRKHVQLARSTADGNQPFSSIQSQNGSNANSSRIQITTFPSSMENNTNLSLITQPFTRPSIFSKPNNNTLPTGLKDINKSLVQPSLTSPILPLLAGAVESSVEETKVPLFQEGKSSQLSSKIPKPISSLGPVEKKGKITQTRISRSPTDGRGRNQLLPRYWPKITEQELQQISGDLNSTIVPLFEKVLSASDAGRIGRLVLPKACAEAYFPPISQSEGLPMRIKDIKGKEWTFQFRFWTNNNSRMYVLEGVTPCLQHMQLEAGDTVTFSRIDPGGKFIIGYRKSTKSVRLQDTQVSAPPNGTSSGETSFVGINGNLPKGNGEHGGVENEEQIESMGIKKKMKNSRQIGMKGKRLHMRTEDALELRVTWEEAQELLCPPPTVIPTIFVVDNHEFEEYDVPPVFGKKTIFAAKETGEQEQWVQCDNCAKWRSLPTYILIPPHWTCSDNICDPSRNSCSAPDEIYPKNLRSCFGAIRDVKKRRMKEVKTETEAEASGLDALATAAVLDDLGDFSVEPTTKHPRHRSGCSCIVCIQPPSGKGKHRPTCICNVCTTVRRRFKTLMLRKRKRQSVHLEPPLAAGSVSEVNVEPASEMGNGVLDLNSYPKQEDELAVEEVGPAGNSPSTVPGEMYSVRNGVDESDIELRVESIHGKEETEMVEG